ncbi:MAG TPA: hypothetical protein VI386_34620 [Candidatus Sulfotelmatobacter sp.]
MRFSRFIVASIVTTSLCVSASAEATRPASPEAINPFHIKGELTATDDPLQLGFVTAISGDTIAATGGGAVYVYTRPAGGWASMTQTAKLTASDGSSLLSVAISGNTIVAGSFVANNFTGAAYVFVEPSGGWTDMTETATLTAFAGAEGDRFGFSVAIVGNTVAVGALQNNSVGITYPVGAGAAYVFMKPVAAWSSTTETAKLTPSDGMAGDDFGYSVAVLGDTVASGAPNATIGGTALEGAVYVFQRSGSTWVNATETAKLTASDGAAVSVVGFDVSISKNNIAASAFNQVYVFTRPSGGWTSATQTAELKDPSGLTFSLKSTDVCGEYVLAGDPLATDHPMVDLYVEATTGWSNSPPAYRFSAPADNGNGSFGWSVGVSGRTMVIASPLNEGSGGNIIYVYAPN